jgi:hypothetical protein
MNPSQAISARSKFESVDQSLLPIALLFTVNKKIAQVRPRDPTEAAPPRGHSSHCCQVGSSKFRDYKNRRFLASIQVCATYCTCCTWSATCGVCVCVADTNGIRAGNTQYTAVNEIAGGAISTPCDDQTSAIIKNETLTTPLSSNEMVITELARYAIKGLSPD